MVTQHGTVVVFNLVVDLRYVVLEGLNLHLDRVHLDRLTEQLHQVFLRQEWDAVVYGETTNSVVRWGRRTGTAAKHKILLLIPKLDDQIKFFFFRHFPVIAGHGLYSILSKWKKLMSLGEYFMGYPVIPKDNRGVGRGVDFELIGQTRQVWTELLGN